jgi:hypothetical protein
MDFLSINSWMIVGAIVGLGLVLAPAVQMVWLMRFLMAGYVALGLVLLMPEQFVFSVYAHMIYFAGIVVFFALVEKGRFFSVSTWAVGRFSPQVFGLSVFLTFFFAAMFCYFLPLEIFKGFLTREVYDLMREYVFYITLAPIVYCIIFAKRG